MEAGNLPGTSVNFYENTRLSIPEDSHLEVAVGSLDCNVVWQVDVNNLFDVT
jgi:hypothetical protein